MTSCPSCSFKKQYCNSTSPIRWNWSITPAGRIIRSEGAPSVCGLSDGELIGLNGFAELAVIENSEDAKNLAQFIQGEDIETIPVKIRHLNGSTVFCNAVRELHYSPDGHLALITGTSQRVAENKFPPFLHDP